ncbi:MAG: protein-(glutamine-N5) methyltransferase, release factor-specific, partial [Alteromonas sp.]
MGLTLATAVQRSKLILEQAGIESAAIDARVLVKHVCDVNDTYLFTYPEKPLSEPQQVLLDEVLNRRAEGEPVAYIVGYRDFWDLRL